MPLPPKLAPLQLHAPILATSSTLTTLLPPSPLPVLPSLLQMIVPMFHANSWGLAFAAPMVGAKLVLPGPHLDGPSVFHMLEAHKVTHTAGVPTVRIAFPALYALWRHILFGLSSNTAVNPI